MRKSMIILAALTMPTLAGCGGNGDDKLGDRVEDAAENRADALDQRADAMKERADQVRDAGERRSDAIDAADIDADAMTAEQKSRIVANGAAAVR